METTLFEVRNLSTWYVSARGARTTKAVNEVSFSLKRGETLGIVGESGCGKSTLVMSLLRLLPRAAKVVSGEVLLDGRDLLTLSEAEMRAIRGKEIGTILQDPMASLNPLFTIGDQVSEPLRAHQGHTSRQGFRAAVGLLDAVRIPAPESRAHEYPHQMSGGMRQRIVGAIAIACNPSLLIADEPTTSLDLTIQAQYLGLLKELQLKHKLGMIFITHNLGIVAQMCDRVAVMYAGRVVETGTVEHIFRSPRHPYTAALIKAIPRFALRDQRLEAVEGHPPDPSNLPTGCAFRPRCPNAMERCGVEPGVTIDGDRSYRCWLGPDATLTPASGVPEPAGTQAMRP